MVHLVSIYPKVQAYSYMQPLWLTERFVLPGRKPKRNMFFGYGIHYFLSFSISVLRREISLHDACRKNEEETVKKILSDKIDVNCRNNVSVHIHVISFFSLTLKECFVTIKPF